MSSPYKTGKIIMLCTVFQYLWFRKPKIQCKVLNRMIIHAPIKHLNFLHNLSHIYGNCKLIHNRRHMYFSDAKPSIGPQMAVTGCTKFFSIPRLPSAMTNFLFPPPLPFFFFFFSVSTRDVRKVN